MVPKAHTSREGRAIPITSRCQTSQSGKGAHHFGGICRGRGNTTMQGFSLMIIMLVSGMLHIRSSLFTEPDKLNAYSCIKATSGGM